MPRPLSSRWFRMWAPELLGDPDPDGFNMAKVLTVQESWCWVALKAACAMSTFQPAICKQPFQGFKDTEFATMFRVPLNVWVPCKQKLAFAGKIVYDSANVIMIQGWDRYSAKYFRSREYKEPLLINMTAEEELRVRASSKAKRDLFVKVIKYLNQKTGKNYRTSGADSFKHFSARFDQGYDFDDFKHVIDVKVQNWFGDSKMEPFLRPETLFSNKFDSYRQERFIVRDRDVGAVGKLKVMPEERAKYEAQAKVAYEKLKNKVMAENGAKTEDDWVNLMFKGKAFWFEEFFVNYIKKMREGGAWCLTNEED